MSTVINHSKIDKVIKRNLSLFNKPGALTVRPGYKMTGGWITDKPSIVVTVDKKLEGLTDDQKLPAEVEDIPVDVREATGLQRLRTSDPAKYRVAKAHIREDLQEPDFLFERSLPSGKILPAQKDSSTLSASGGAAKKQIKYSPPASTPLSKFTGVTTITACASPDAGYGVLNDFLGQTQSDLTIAMYDFTSGALLADVTGLVGPKNLPFKMVLDHPPKNPTANQTDEQTKAAILAADPDNAKINWALTRNDPEVTEWIFPTAYHIKVIVQDGKIFWLSSGNLNVSNEPATPAQQKTGDRDWHVIVQNNELAQLYKAFIDNDFAVAQGGQGTGNAAVHAKINAALTALRTESSKSTVKPATATRKLSTSFPAKVFKDVQVSIQPLLTPDAGIHTSMYVDNVLNLINSAQRSVYIQTQYVHPSSAPADADFMLLVTALSNAHKNGLDVRLITSQYENTAQWIETLKPFDLDQVLRIQNKVHNKGIVIDSKVVMVSSQNWSADGCLRNRDAGLIIENADIAAYFGSIFMNDWVNLATEKIADTSTPAST